MSDTTYSTLDPLVLWLEQNSHNHLAIMSKREMSVGNFLVFW